MAEGEMEVYESFQCTARLYFRSPQRPVEHRCRLTLAGGSGQRCSLTLEGEACQRRTFRVSKENVTNVVARLGEGSMTVVFRHGCCDSVVVKEVIDRGALTRCHKIISAISMGLGDVSVKGTPPTVGRERSLSGVGETLSAGGRRKIELTLKRRYGDSRGGRMLEAAQNKSATAASSFYKSDSPTVESFLPQTSPNSSPFFQRPARRNLTLELSEGRRESPTGVKTSPQSHLGPRKAAVMARKRLPLGNAPGQIRSGSEVKDYLEGLEEPPSREGFANLGNTCYMNAVLQVLLGLEPFAEDLLNQQLVKVVEPHSLCRMMYLLLKSKRAKDSYESQRILLKKIKSVIESSRPKFSGYRQQDAHELLTQCLDQLKDDSKSVRTAASEEDKQPQLPVCPVIRNFECGMCRSITCKSCRKVNEVSEVFYDFALQLPKSVISRPNEQANLQDLLERFFNSEEVEYKCPVCPCNRATMSCRMARLPRVMIIFLKRYGYNSNSSRNSKRIDFIRIPRFIAVGNFCSESTAPPYEYDGPWPRAAETPSTSDNKENLPSSSTSSTAGAGQDLPVEIFPAAEQPGGPAVGNSSSGGRILGKRRGSESVVQEGQWEREFVKKFRVDEVSVSVASRVQPTTSGPAVDTGGCTALSQTSSSIGFIPLTSSGLVTCGTSSTAVVSSGREMVAGTDNTNADVDYSQNSVGRDIAAEFDSLFSPEILLQLDNTSQVTSAIACSAPPATTTSDTTRFPGSVSTSGTVSSTANQPPLNNTFIVSGGNSTHNPTTGQSERTLPRGDHANGSVEEERLMLGLFGGVSSEGDSSGAVSGREGAVTRAPAPVVADCELRSETEDLGLQRAMEESMREQTSDVELLQQMGLSEEEQLKLALELSMQEQCVEECGMDQQQVSRESAEPEMPTPDTHRPATYKLMGIVNHIGKASSGGHYVSDVCSGREGVWRSYNDSYVMEAREEDIRQKRKGTGYIFFYMHKSVLGSISKRTTST